MKTQSSIYLSEKDMKKVRELVKYYDSQSASELYRTLINNEYNQLLKYKEMIEEKMCKIYVSIG